MSNKGHLVTEYYHGELDTLASFVAHWQSKSATDPEHYPIRLSMGEWGEQYSLYSEQCQNSTKHA